MSMSLCRLDRMMPMRGMHGMRSMHGLRFMTGMRSVYDMGFMNGIRFSHCMQSMDDMQSMCGMQKPGSSEIADRIISNGDKDGDGALSADELGKLIDRIGLVEADFNLDGLIDKEKLISKISEKLEEMEWSPKKRGLKMYRTCMGRLFDVEIDRESTDAVSETQSRSDTEPAETISEIQGSSFTDSVDLISEPESIMDLVKQLLSRLNLSEEKTESFLETMKSYGINATS